MTYEFTWSAFFIGILILAASAALIAWHRPIADTMASGVSSYDRFKLWGLIGCGLGIVVMLNLHVMILKWVFGSIF